LGSYLTNYVEKKKETERLDAVPKDVMMPESMLQASPIVTPPPAVSDAPEKTDDKTENEPKKEAMTDLIGSLSSLL
tara:strand:- start:237 stop:464 length:228 start_codon:yes stop_codon:yes gene_type:complete